MSLWRDELKPTRATLVCLITLAAIAVGSLSRVVDGPSSTGWALAALVIGSAFALSFGQRSLGVAFGLLIVFSLATLPVLFLRDSSARLVPTPSSMSAVQKLIAEGFTGISTSTPPVPSEPRFLILVWLALLLLGFLGAAWVVVRRPVGAVVSALAVVTFAGSIGDGAGRNIYAVGAIAATGAFFLAEGRQRIARWGGGRITIPAWLGLPTLAAACLVAVGAPLVIGEAPILQLNTVRPRVVIIKPLSDIRRQLKVDPPLEVLRVEAAQPAYWRLTALDAYDGREWVLHARPRDVREGKVPPASPPSSGAALEQKYRLTSLLSPWLPAAYAATDVDSTQPVQVDEGSQTLLLRNETRPGLAYTVRSQKPRVTNNLEADPKDTDDPNARIFGGIAKPLVAGARTPLDRARRLETHFRKFRYSEDVAAGHTAARLQRFLRDRAGYCEQFAATMTLMLRGLGVEARVGVGFLPGVLTSGEYIVSTRDAHAWVEAKIPGAGWVSFDPTPGRGEATSVPPQAQEQPSEPQQVPQVTTLPQPTLVPDDLPEGVTREPLAGRIPAGVLWSVVAIALIGSVPAAKSFRRSRRKRGPPELAVVGAYTELIDRARDLGSRPRASETQREFVSRVLARSDEATRLAHLTARALYSHGPTDPADARAAWTASLAAHRSLRQRTSFWRRSIAIFDPRTLLPAESWRPAHLLRRARLRAVAALNR